MRTTKSILCLWAGCSALACFAAFGIAYDRGTMAVIVAGNLDLGGGQSFALGFPSLVSGAIALVGAVLAVTGLFVSWQVNKQPLFSAPHAATLFFLVPLMFVALLFR